MVACSDKEVEQYEKDNFNKEVGTIGNNASDSEFREKFFVVYERYLENGCYKKEWLDEVGLTVGDFQRYVNGGKQCKDRESYSPPQFSPIPPVEVPKTPKEENKTNDNIKLELNKNRW